MLKPDRPRLAGPAAAVLPAMLSGPASSDGPPTAEQLAAVRQFVARVGGIDQARDALELLAILSAAGKAKGQSAR